MKALVRKNLRLKRRSLVGLIVEILLPVATTCVVFLSMWASVPGMETPVAGYEIQTFAPRLNDYCVSEIWKQSYWAPRCTLGYVNSPLLSSLISDLKNSSDFEFIEFESVTRLYDKLNNITGYFDSGLLVAIFESEKKINIVGPDNTYFSSQQPFYTNTPVASIVSYIVGKETVDQETVYVSQLPVFQTTYQNLNFFGEYWVGAVFVLVLFLSLSSTIVGVAYEKENHLLTTLLVAGVSYSYYLFSWFLVQFVIGLIAMTLSIIPPFAVSVIVPSAFFECWIILVVYVAAYIAKGFLISTLFKKAKFVVLWAFGYTLLSIMFGICLIMPIFWYVENQALIYLLGIVMSLLFEGVPLIAALFVYGVASDFQQPAPSWADSYFPIGLCFVLLVIDTVIYLLLYLWLSQAKIRGYCYCCRKQKKREMIVGKNDSELLLNHGNNNNNNEIKGVGVELVHLKKEFGKNVAVNDISVEIQPNMITCLLGENGAGKSTVIGMLTGEIAPSSGSIFVNGIDLIDNLNVVRKNTGVCFQQDILWESLTVRNHLELFCEIKGVPFGEIDQMLQRLMLDPNQITKTLSGGQKRKLSLMIALVGNPTFLLCDEPCSGIDPAFQLEIWKILQNFQKNNDSTVLLTTHEMQEAETLASVVIIMRKGQVKVVGGINELAEKYGLGYKLLVAHGADADYVQQLIKEEGIKNHRGQVEFNIGNDVESFSRYFHLLREKNIHFKLTASSLREVFLEIADEGED